jgi:hypothetical protein
MTIEGFWIDDRIYWTLWYSSWLHFIFHYYTRTIVPTVMSYCRCLVATSNVWRSPSPGFPNYPRPQLPASHSNSSERLNRSSYLTNSPTHPPERLTGPVYNISAPIAQKHRSSVAVYTPLHSNGRCLVAYFAVVAWQRVYMPQYLNPSSTFLWDRLTCRSPKFIFPSACVEIQSRFLQIVEIILTYFTSIPQFLTQA